MVKLESVPGSNMLSVNLEKTQVGWLSLNRVGERAIAVFHDIRKPKMVTHEVSDYFDYAGDVPFEEIQNNIKIKVLN